MAGELARSAVDMAVSNAIGPDIGGFHQSEKRIILI
jgi:hypothetical protein